VEESIYKLNRSRSTSSFISGNTKNQDQPLLTLKDVESLFATAVHCTRKWWKASWKPKTSAPVSGCCSSSWEETEGKYSRNFRVIIVLLFEHQTSEWNCSKAIFWLCHHFQQAAVVSSPKGRASPRSVIDCLTRGCIVVYEFFLLVYIWRMLFFSPLSVTESNLTRTSL